MARPLRLAFPWAVYHVTSRGDTRQTMLSGVASQGAIWPLEFRGFCRFSSRECQRSLYGEEQRTTYLGLDYATRSAEPLLAVGRTRDRVSAAATPIASYCDRFFMKVRPGCGERVLLVQFQRFAEGGP